MILFLIIFIQNKKNDFLFLGRKQQ